jgi:transcriptional regulator with XRE-family HTH domain
MSKNQVKMDPQIVEAEESFLIDFQFLVQDLIDAMKISRSDLAKRAGLTKGRLSQILSAEANPTVKTFARLFLGAQCESDASSGFSGVRNSDLLT